MVTVSEDESRKNWLLAALPSPELRRLLRQLEQVSLDVGDVLYEAGQSISYVYFPCSGLVSLLTPAEDGKEVEIGVVGQEGMIGLAAFLSGEKAPFRAMVQGIGKALRLPADALRKEARRSQRLTDVLMRFVDAFLVQMSQSAACRSLHSVPSRYSYWLLMAHDRIGSDYLPFDQKFLAWMLAVRLASVTQAARAIRKAGLIHYTRGGIHILDRPGLEAVSCPCYRIIRDRLDLLLAR